MTRNALHKGHRALMVLEKGRGDPCGGAKARVSFPWECRYCRMHGRQRAWPHLPRYKEAGRAEGGAGCYQAKGGPRR